MKRFYYEVGSIDEFSKCRFGIIILDESNADMFLRCIDSYKVSTSDLQKMYLMSNEKQIYLPSLYVNFDNRCLISQFPELDKFEDFVPAGWRGDYKAFDDLLPRKIIYWR